MIDVAVASRAFLDVTFLGLDALPGPGEERFARDVLRSPGGGATIAIGAARLGLSVALASPVGSDEAGETVRGLLAAEGIELVAPHPGRTATTVVLPVDGERAMVTYDERVPPRPADLERLAPRAVVCGSEELGDVPDDAWAYAGFGDDEARRHAGRPPAALAGARAVLVNEAEALLLTGARSPEEAAQELAALAPAAVVTLGPRGALGIFDGRPAAAPGVPSGPVVDTTGAGDLFAAAYVWADLHGAEPEERLRWATLYATLSVTVPTAAAGAATVERLFEEAARRGAPPLRQATGQVASASSPKEE